MEHASSGVPMPENAELVRSMPPGLPMKLRSGKPHNPELHSRCHAWSHHAYAASSDPTSEQ
eukprot:8996495-Lingulodinium_polyedra.AAC.1